MQASLKRIPPSGQNAGETTTPQAQSPNDTPESAPTPANVETPIDADTPDDTITPEAQAFETAQAVVNSFDQLSQQVAQLGKQLRHAQKLASLGTMSAMLAHEFNNLLTPIVSYSQYALRKNDPELIHSAAERAYTQSTRVVELCERILGLATGDEQEVTDVNLEKLVNDSIKCIGRDLAKDNITTTLNIDHATTVIANSNLIQQVLFNLILNARQAMLGRPGHLTITATQKDQTVTIAIQDNGPGIKSADLPQIFEPFFSTKQNPDRPDKGGAGLGLAVCKDIIEEHNGTITATSTPGQATTFTITLPAGK